MSPAVRYTAGLLFTLSITGAAHAQDGCSAPEQVCAARDKVFAVSSAFDPYASAVRIGADLLVTNRHAVADETKVEIVLKDGSRIPGEVVPTSFEADLVLVRAKLPDGPVFGIGGANNEDIYAVGQDISRRSIRVFPKGRVIRAAASDKPLSRIHHTAYTQPGVSGGALVNGSGELVGVATSGGAGRFEAVPAGRIETLRERSGEAHAERSTELGKAYRSCIIDVEKAQRMRDTLPEEVRARIKSACGNTRNRQLYDMAGQVFGKSREFDTALDFFHRSIETDPNAINARIGLVITLTFARRNEEALEHVRWLIDTVPESTEVQRFAVHVGKSTGDMELARKGLALIEKHNPAQLEAAKRFLEAPVPQLRRPPR